MSTVFRFALVALFASSIMAAETTCLVNNTQIMIRGGDTPCVIAPAAWGPKWAFMGWRGQATSADGVSSGSFNGNYKGAPSPTTWKQEVRATSSKQLEVVYTLSTDKDQSYTQICTALNIAKTWAGSIEVMTGGQSESKPWPLARGALASGISSVIVKPVEGQALRISFDPPIDASVDGQIRFKLADSLIGGTEQVQHMSIEFPTDIAFYGSIDEAPDEPDKDRWFAWQPTYSYGENNAFSMTGWNNEAGAKGRITRKEGELIYDNKPIKLWGLNNCYSSCAPEKELADKRAAFYAAHGVNAVRLHKWGDGFGWKGILKPGSNTEFDEKLLDQLDYYIAALKKQGIYVKLSNTFGSMSLAADGWDRIPYASDWGKKPGAKKDLRTGAGAVFLSSELQDLHIEQMTNLLKHVNPYTGLRYADDPAIVLVEMCNEESALFFGTLGQLQKSKTLRDRAGKAFCSWLLERYGSAEEVLERWGDGGLNAFQGHEHLPDPGFEAGIIYPVGGP